MSVKKKPIEQNNHSTESPDKQSAVRDPEQVDDNTPVGLPGDFNTGTMPEIQQHVVDEHEQKERETLEQTTGQTDKSGNTFDPAIHKIGDDGKPVFTKAGNFAKKRGRKTGQTNSQLKTGVPEKSPEQKQIESARAAGVALANVLITTGRAIGGVEWDPVVTDNINERANLENAFADYCQVKGVSDIPPGIALTMAIGAYVLPRFTMPVTKTRVSKFKDWMQAKIANWKVKRNKSKPVDQSQPAKQARSEAENQTV